MTDVANSHKFLIMPTVALDESAKDYAIVLAVPINAPGITMIFGSQGNDSRRDNLERIDVGRPRFASVGGEAVIAFEDVFIPNERIFMNGEVDHRGSLVYRFAAHHRANYCACKTGLMDVLTVAVSYFAQIRGPTKDRISRKKSLK